MTAEGFDVFGFWDFGIGDAWGEGFEEIGVDVAHEEIEFAIWCSGISEIEFVEFHADVVDAGTEGKCGGCDENDDKDGLGWRIVVEG